MSSYYSFKCSSFIPLKFHYVRGGTQKFPELLQKNLFKVFLQV